MKKILSFICFFIIQVTLFGQIDRSGNLSTETWSQTVHITADATIGDGVTITISAGVTVELYSGVSLKIMGSGTLLADAGSGTAITFTAYNGTSWGHLYFNNTSASGNSRLINCIIEKGNAVGLSPAYGGGLSINSNKITVENCIIKNNIADLGGGIHIGIGFGPVIKNCFISSNTSNNGGGGIHSYAGTTTELINCIISNNTVPPASNLYGGGGILIGFNANAVKITNCTFANNSCPNGSDINLFGSNSLPKIVNSILWSSSPIMYSGSQGLNSGDFTNCAIRSSLASSFTDCIEISGINNAVTGPNFRATDGSDWSINVNSPCVDAGTSSGAPTTDIIGNSRILATDIGSYEVQYTRWKTDAGSTDWNTSSNWEGLTTSTAQVVYISPGAVRYPTYNTPAPDFSIESGKELVIGQGAEVTFDQLTNNGDLILISDISGTSSLITNNSVNAIVELFLTGGGSSSTYKWHYISSPVSALPVNTFILKPTMDFAQYFEARPTTNPLQGWIAYDGYVYYTGGYLTGSPYVISGTNLNVGQGYNYFYTSDHKFTFSGNINVSSVSPTITYAGNASLHGFNLLGNPFSSGLDWTTITDDPGYPTMTSKGLYFTRDNTQCSYISGVGYPDASVTGIIPPMQGFFIRTTNTSTTLPLLAGARAHNIPARYKGEGETIPLVRLQLDNDSIKDNTVVRFDTKASSTFDNDFDAVRMFLSEAIQYIYSTDGISKYAINGQPFPETTLQIPLSVNILLSGNHSITATQLQGLDTYTIGLKDNTTGFTADLKSNPSVLFSSDSGTFTDRFVLVVSGSTTAIPEYPGISEKAFNIYHYQNMLNIQTFDNEWDGKTGSVSIFSLTGKMVESEQNVEFYKNSLIQIPAPGTKGLYVVEIKSGVNRYVGKVVIK